MPVGAIKNRKVVALCLGVVFIGVIGVFVEAVLRIGLNLDNSAFSSRTLYSATFEKAFASPPNPAATSGWPHERIKNANHTLPVVDPSPSYLTSRRYFYYDKKIHARRPIPNSFTTVTKLNSNGEKIYDATYNFDSYGKRIIPNRMHKSKHESRALFLGCSFTLGEGLPSEMTFASVFSKTQSEYLAEILAFHAWGPTVILAYLQNMPLAKTERDTSRDIAYYTFIDQHFHRTFGSSSMATNDGWLKSIAFYDPSQSLFENRGSYFENRPAQYYLLRSLFLLKDYSMLLKLILPDLPYFNDSHTRSFAKLVKQLKTELADRQKIFKFKVILFPGSYFGPALGNELLAIGIDVIDWSRVQLSDYTMKPYIPQDGHPSAEAAALVGTALSMHVASKNP
jgi:hypothetical protein